MLRWGKLLAFRKRRPPEVSGMIFTIGKGACRSDSDRPSQRSQFNMQLITLFTSMIASKHVEVIDHPANQL